MSRHPAATLACHRRGAMILKRFEAFHLAATPGGFAPDAQRAHVTRSSLSKHVAELEA